MKKLIIGFLMASLSAVALADNVIIEGSNVQGVNGSKDGKGFLMKYTKTINNSLEGDVQYQTTQTDGTNAMSTRLEAGLTPSYNVGPVKLYTRAVAGEKYVTTGSGHFSYYSFEPGFIAPLGGNFSARIGWRYRNAFDSTANADETRTWRAGVKYDFNKQDAVNLRYDRSRGDQNQNIWALSYIRSF